MPIKTERAPQKTVAMIFFSDSVEQERIEKWIAKLKEQGHVDNAQVAKYDPEFDCPCLYFP